MAEGQDRSARLDHLTGARALCAIWIVCCHFVPPEPAGPLAAARNRGNAGVCFFVVLSGFITQWVYAAKAAAGAEQVLAYLARRVCRVLLTTWVAMFCGLLVVLVQRRAREHLLPDGAYLARCFLLVEPWVDPFHWCPNGQTWTVAALLPSWLLFPLTCRALAAAELRGGAGGLLLLAALLWFASAGPLLALFLLQGMWVTGDQFMWGYIWPPSQLADFAVGAACAALARRCSAAGLPHGRCGVVAHAALADASAVVAAALVLAVPSGGEREGWEALFSHGLTPLYAAFLFGSCARGSAGLAASLLSHGALVGLGEYSLEAYLFQWPMHEVFVALGDVTGAFSMRQRVNDNACGFLAFAVCLWIFSAAYAEFVEAPLVRWLRGPGDDAAGQRTSYGLLGAQTPTQAERGGEAAAAG